MGCRTEALGGVNLARLSGNEKKRVRYVAIFRLQSILQHLLLPLFASLSLCLVWTGQVGRVPQWPVCQGIPSCFNKKEKYVAAKSGRASCSPAIAVSLRLNLAACLSPCAGASECVFD